MILHAISQKACLWRCILLLKAGLSGLIIWSDISQHGASKVKISHLQLMKYKAIWHQSWLNQDWLEQTDLSRFADLSWFAEKWCKSKEVQISDFYKWLHIVPFNWSTKSSLGNPEELQISVCLQTAIWSIEITLSGVNFATRAKG